MAIVLGQGWLTSYKAKIDSDVLKVEFQFRGKTGSLQCESSNTDQSSPIDCRLTKRDSVSNSDEKKRPLVNFDPGAC